MVYTKPFKLYVVPFKLKQCTYEAQMFKITPVKLRNGKIMKLQENENTITGSRFNHCIQSKVVFFHIVKNYV